MERIDSLEIEELAEYLILNHEDYEGDFPENPDFFDYSQHLEYYYDIDIEQLEIVLNIIMPLFCVDKSALTDKWYKGLADEKNGCWIIKREI